MAIARSFQLLLNRRTATTPLAFRDSFREFVRAADIMECAYCIYFVLNFLYTRAWYSSGGKSASRVLPLSATIILSVSRITN